jgi:DNA repair protein RAD5
VFCYDCITLAFSSNTKCPYCTTNLKKTDISIIAYKDKMLQQKDDQNKINVYGTKIGNLIEYLKNKSNNVVIFSQWDELLAMVSKILFECNIKNIICKGNAYQRENQLNEFENGDAKIIMLSTDNNASGTNLTKANEVILLDPVYGDKQHRIDIENQAIGRINRIGQTSNMTVTRFVIKNTIEEQIYLSNNE